jgi:hypothetical protein
VSCGARGDGDNVAEWLRRQPAKLMGFARVGSNPTVVVLKNWATPKKKAPEVRLELTTYRLTAGRATDCAIQEHTAFCQPA